MASPLTTPITVIAGILLPSSAPVTAQYTAVKKTVIKWIELNNTDTSARTVTFYNGTVADANQVFKITLEAAGSVGSDQMRTSSAIVEIGGILTVIADVASKVRCAVYGATYEVV